jgi:hypothetical protein
MALVNRLQCLSPSLSSTHFRKPKSVNFHPICSLYYDSSSYSSSPFTEKHSFERYQRDEWLYTNQVEKIACCSFPPDSDSIRQDDIALQLPELNRLLQVLREKRESEGCGGGKCGPGNVFLVGTGPGDPELLTLKAVRVIQSADLLLYDRLVSNEVLDLIGPEGRLLYVGKTAGYHSRTQVKILSICLASFLIWVCVFPLIFKWVSVILINLFLYLLQFGFAGIFVNWLCGFLLIWNGGCDIGQKAVELGLWAIGSPVHLSEIFSFSFLTTGGNT